MRLCIGCGKEINKRYSRKGVETKRCLQCFREYQKSKEYRKEKSEKGKNVGAGKWMKGKKMSEETKRKISLSTRKEKSQSWKGVNAGYFTKHHGVSKEKGRPESCVDCGLLGHFKTLKNGVQRWSIQWSNVDGRYSRSSEDYIGRCISCHMKYDRKLRIAKKSII